MPNIELVTARTDAVDPEAAAEAICQQLGPKEPKLVTVFASRSRDHLALNRELRKRLPKARLVGASSSAEIDRDGIHVGTVVVSAMSGDFDVGIGLGKKLSEDAVAAGNRAVTHACDELGIRPVDLGKRHVGMVIDDGFRHKKEEFLIGMLEPNPSLVLVGGGASDFMADPSKASAVVHVDGQVIDDAVVVVLFQTDAKWAAMRSHWYVPAGRTIRITKVDASCMRALEIDGKPAAKHYADLLGVGIDDLEFGKPNGFAASPTALLVGREYFMRAPWRALEDGSILFANLIDEGTELELMRLGDMAGSTRRFLSEEIPARVGNPAATFLFHCGARDWFAHCTSKDKGLSDAFHVKHPIVGMNVYFELYCGFQINTTLTALAFGNT